MTEQNWFKSQREAYDTGRSEALFEVQHRINAAVAHIKTAIGSLDDPTGPHVVEGVRRVRDVVLIDAHASLNPPEHGAPSAPHTDANDTGGK